MIDPITTLAFNVYSNPGVYALLLGSGTSRSAGILTGWEITLDLIRRVAALNGDKNVTDAEEWYVNKYKKSPSYSDLLGDLGPTATERHRILRSYFEPTEDDRAAGMKVFKAGHMAIAGLMSSGKVKTIITTNFDRLVEEAMQSIGSQPLILASEDAVLGAEPLTHTNGQIIKVNGDYQDPRIKNTPPELANYPENMCALIERVFDEYGLIVCGWSGEWDSGLVSLLKRRRSRRYSIYWAHRGTLTPQSQDLITQIGAIPIKIADADSFLVDLEQRITSLARMDSDRHPASKSIVQHTLKRLLRSEGSDIQLRDFVRAEVLETGDKLAKYNSLEETTSESVAELIGLLDHQTDILSTVVVIGSYYGNKEHANNWGDILTLISRATKHCALRDYVPLKLFYLAGVGSILGKKVHNLSSILKAQVQTSQFLTESAFRACDLNLLLGDTIRDYIEKYENFRLPAHECLERSVKPYFSDLANSQEELEDAWNRFEYIRALLYQFREIARHSSWVPACSITAYRDPETRQEFKRVLDEEISTMKWIWPDIVHELFDGSQSEMFTARQRVDEFLGLN